MDQQGTEFTTNKSDLQQGYCCQRHGINDAASAVRRWIKKWRI